MADKRLSGKKLDQPPGGPGEIFTGGDDPATTGAPPSPKAGIPALRARPAPPSPSYPSSPRTPRNAGVVVSHPGDASNSTTISTTANSAASSSSSRPPVDYKIRRDAAIDQFKSRHATDFASEDFGIAFAILLRKWKQDNRDADIAVLPAAMNRLYRNARKNLGHDDKPERDGPPVESPVRKPPSSVSQRAPGSATSGWSTPRGSALTPALPPGKVTLNEERLVLLDRFAKKPGRQPSFERYPALMDRLYREALAWASKDTGGSFGLALKVIFDDALLECFHGTCVLMGDAPLPDMNDMQTKINLWKAENKGEDLTLEVLWRIMPKLMRSLTLGVVAPTRMTRNAEAVTEAFMQRPVVTRELQENRLLKKRFLHDIRAWIALGEFSEYPEITVLQIYHEALTMQHQDSLAAAGFDAAQIGKVRLAVMHWCVDHDIDVLTTEVLAALSASVTGKDKG